MVKTLQDIRNNILNSHLVSLKSLDECCGDSSSVLKSHALGLKVAFLDEIKSRDNSEYQWMCLLLKENTSISIFYSQRLEVVREIKQILGGIPVTHIEKVMKYFIYHACEQNQDIIVIIELDNITQSIFEEIALREIICHLIGSPSYEDTLKRLKEVIVKAHGDITIEEINEDYKVFVTDRNVVWSKNIRVNSGYLPNGEYYYSEEGFDETTIRFIMDLEVEFGIEIEDKNFKTIVNPDTTVKELAQYIRYLFSLQ